MIIRYKWESRRNIHYLCSLAHTIAKIADMGDRYVLYVLDEIGGVYPKGGEEDALVAAKYSAEYHMRVEYEEGEE